MRRDLLRDALRFYQEFPQERGDSAVVRSEAVSAYRRVGQIQVLLGQRDEGEAAYGQAVALLDQLRAESPGDPDVLGKLGGVYHPKVVSYILDAGGSYANMAAHVRRSRSAEASLEWYDRAIRTEEPVLTQDPRDVRARMGLFTDYIGRGQALLQLGRREEAERDWRRILELSADHPEIRMRLYRPSPLANLGEHVRATTEMETLPASGYWG